MTIVEVVVAAVVLALGAMATFGVLSSATKNNQRAKASQVALNRAQQDIETLRSLENDQLAMTAAPSHSSASLNPNFRVSGGTFALLREPPSEYANLVVNGGSLYGGGFVEGGIVSPGPTPFTSGDVSGKIYRYVVWRNDASCPAATCPGEQDYKQIVVAVKLDTPGSQSGERGYVEVTSDFVDPTDSALGDPIPGANGVVTAQQFYFSDTPCASSGTTARQDIVADHLMHNTLGACAAGLQTGPEIPGAPDALLLGVPPDPDVADESNPPLYDYSDDSYLEPTPDTDKGVQILPDTTAGCHFTPTGTTHPNAQVHRWVTDPMTSSFTMLEKVTLEFYTRTLNDDPGNGELCVFLFKRHETGTLPPTDTRLTNKETGKEYWAYNPGGTGWWRGVWEKVRLTMPFNGSPKTIEPGDRLGVALSVERSNTTGNALSFMFDHPKFPTRIEVDTNTPINGG
jgi:type II secretory pathway pseudopilin PulG